MLDTLLKLNSTRAGHDKIIRTLQYTCKFIAASENSNSPLYHAMAAKIGSARKMLRFGTCIEALYSSFNTPYHQDGIYQMLVSLSNISNAMYLFCDHLLWLHNNNWLNINHESWDNLSDRFWLYSIILDLVRDLHHLRNLTIKLDLSSNPSPVFVYLFQHHKNLLVDLIKNTADVFLPLSSLGHIKCSPKFVAFSGIVSSLVGLSQTVNPLLKL